MTLLKLLTQGIRYHKRLYLGLLAGTIIACATVTGALAVGDSVQQTLRWIAEARLGGVGHALDWGHRYFDVALMTAVTAELETTEGTPAAVFAVRGMAEPARDHTGAGRRLNRAHVYGVDSAFWALAPEPDDGASPKPQEAFVNEAAARTLGVAVGDDIRLRLVRPAPMPAEAPLAQGGDDTAVARLRVARVLNEAQWGRFSMVTDQAMPANIFVDRHWLAQLLDMSDKANMLLAPKTLDGAQLHAALRRAWQPAHVGYRFREHAAGVTQLESDRLFIEDVVVAAAQDMGEARPLLKYLVNSIAAHGKSTPYSFVTAGAGPADMPPDAVAVNEWLANALDIATGDTLTITWNEPLPSGEFRERSTQAPVHAVLSMDALQLEQDLALSFPGLSDVDTCRDWDIGLPLDEEKLQDEANEAYWNEYRQTPKLIADFETGRDWWGTRFGTVMAIRFEDTGKEDATSLMREHLDPAAIGLAFQPARENALRAVEQAMDFGPLFMGMSMFLIAAALTVLALLYAHGLQMRAGEMGTLLAVGWTPRRVRAWLALESLPVIIAGVTAGVPGGVGYARLLLYGLTRFWPDAVAGTPIRFYVAATTLVQAAVIAAVCVFITILVCAIRAGRRPARELLQRDFTSGMAVGAGGGWPGRILCMVMMLVVGFAVVQAVFVSRDNPAPWFFVSGAAALTMLCAAYATVLGGIIRRETTVAPPRLWRLVLTQLARRRSRSVGIAIVTGCGLFMVVSVFAMQAAMTFDPQDPASGTGGFSVFATTQSGVRGDETVPLGLSWDDMVAMRVWDGDDAGCLNLNRARQPRLYGVAPERLIARNAFARENEAASLWELLSLSLDDDVIPALVGDTDTALWGLQATTDPERGDQFEYIGDTGEVFQVRTVGRLPMRLSVFQGALLISEAHFTRMFPYEAGYRAFLVDAATPDETAAQLNEEHGRRGMEATTSEARLRAFYAVERAYLTLFLVLGGIGMMLGAGGAAVIVLRNMAERRAECALLIALGYPPHVVRRMALAENALLVVAGILFGIGAAALAVIPLMLQAHAAANLTALAIICCAVIAAYLATVLIATRLYLNTMPLAALRTE